ncbi:hypothetical protein Tco_0312868 [Tanacetum coccineum]
MVVVEVQKQPHSMGSGTYSENVVPGPATVGQPPRKDPQMGYSMIVPQSEQKLVILLGQKNTLAEYMILFSADNRPPMLDKDLIPHPRDDPISFLNKAMAFLFLKGRQGQSYSSIGYKSKATSFGGNNTSEHARVVKCNNGQDSGKCFTPQQELSAEQDFLLRISNPTIESSNKPHVIVEVPSELPKVSLVNASFKKLKFHLAQFNSVVKKRTTLDACTEELLLENDRLLQQIMSQDVLLTMMNSMSLNGESLNMERKRNESCD